MNITPEKDITVLIISMDFKDSFRIMYPKIAAKNGDKFWITCIVPKGR